MRKCELCNSIARMFCESDQASLCWDCDAKVHSANFLVAKHSRTLLCRSCQSITPWTGSGSKLGPTLSFCETCAQKNPSNINDHDQHHCHIHDFVDVDDDDDAGEYDDDEDEDEDLDEDYDGDEDDGENQVVPLSSLSSSSLDPPQVSSSSSYEESSGRSLVVETLANNQEFHFHGGELVNFDKAQSQDKSDTQSSP